MIPRSKRSTMRAFLSLLPLSFLISIALTMCPLTLGRKQPYVVYLGGHSHGAQATSYDLERATDSHYELLGSLLGSKEKAKDAIFYSYTRFINGFAANLEEKEASEIAKYSRVLSVFPSKGRELHTTHSWNFLGLERWDGRVSKKSIWHKARFGEDVIIGNLDSGVWPESKSFSDEGIGPIPSKWKGICQNNSLDAVHCNRKLIGVRFFKDGYEADGNPLNATLSSARDFEGHGTHTLSTAGGHFVPRASVFGHGKGTAKGAAPRSRVAAYKVCWPLVDGKSCYDSDVIAAFDAAIHDGVDIISVSLGGNIINYFEDGISIGSFHAVKNGIMVVGSAGNIGIPSSVLNTAPWIFTVGASTIDRKFASYVLLGSKQRFKGESLSNSSLPAKRPFPLISSKDANAANATEEDAQFCSVGSLDPEKVKGKIVLCLRGGAMNRIQKGKVVLDAGGMGMIIANSDYGDDLMADAHILPATHISATDGNSLLNYIKSTKSPTAYITYPKTKIGARPAPLMASFSSQGPNPIVSEILKPDITAPGVNIIAAFSEASAPSELPLDARRVPFSAMSGTSMSCPHVAGIAALLKVLHPYWSPAAIRSALMTTARTRDNRRKSMMSSSLMSANPFSYGAGHVQPNRAMDPGLVYDLKVDDYLNFMCSLGYLQREIVAFGKPYKCQQKSPDILNFNYPSITIPNLSGIVNVTRTLKNVGPPGTYKVRVREPEGISVSVEPTSLEFERVGDEKVFSLIVKPSDSGGDGEYVFGKITWSDGFHHVRSPLVVSAVQM